MPRLLLVDDNPSIHRIAESLLAPTDVALVCVGSAAEALAQLERGESFDVALVDTAMPGMDGWTLVSRLRASEATATLPIALMAGVLDPVDPVRLASAPVQGFLKKPIELRELGDRVKALMAIPVLPPAPSPSPFSTVPATPARELLQRAEAALPEFRPEPEAAAQPEVEADLLVLTAEDVWVEEPVVDLGDLPDVQLELEELDLGSLPVAVSQAAPVEPLPEPSAPLAMDAALPSLPDLEDLDLGALPGEALDLGEADRAVREEAEERSGTDAPPEDLFADLPPLSLVEPALDQMEPALDQMEPAWGLDEPAPQPPPAPEAAEPVLDAPESAPVAAEGQAAAVSGQAHPGDGGTDAQARAVVQALLADPVLVDALVKAVVARMGDQILREIAWEVFPDLAGKLRS